METPRVIATRAYTPLSVTIKSGTRLVITPRDSGESAKKMGPELPATPYGVDSRMPVPPSSSRPDLRAHLRSEPHWRLTVPSGDFADCPRVTHAAFLARAVHSGNTTTAPANAHAAQNHNATCQSY